MRKNRNAPDSYHEGPIAISPIRWIIPETMNVRMRTPYRARSVPLGRRKIEKDMKLAGARYFCLAH